MTPREQAERWQRQAKADLRTAQTLFNNNEFGPCAFYCQQAAEKALKAVLYARGVKVLGHSLIGLLTRIANEGIAQADDETLKAANALDEHYMTPRYPDAFESQIPADHYTQALAEETLTWARLLMQYSGKKLA